MKKIIALIAALFVATPALAQWQTPNHTVPIGRGQGTGFKSTTTGTVGQVLTSNGASADPSFKDSVPAVAIENFGGGCAVSDNTAALVAAVASTGTGPVRVLFNGACDYTFTQPDALIFAKAGVYLQGAGRGVTFLKYSPPSGAPGNGTFLYWKAPIGPLPMFSGGLLDIGWYSDNYDSTKVMVRNDAISFFTMQNVNCGVDASGVNATVSGGDGSICYYPHGWDFGSISNYWFSADRPIVIGINPNNSAFSQDHWDYENSYLQVPPQRIKNDGSTVSNAFPAIDVDPGVFFTSVKFRGIQSWVGSVGGFKYADTGAVNYVSGVTSGGATYAVGNLITIAGGTCSVQPVVQVTGVSAGVIASASIKNPGVCTVVPSNPVSQASVSPSGGTGAQFNLATLASLRLAFDGVRTEQGRGGTGANYSFYISPAAQISGLEIRNSVLDGGQKGIFLKNSIFTTIADNSYIGSNSLEVINATATNVNDQIVLSNNFWNTGNTADLTGLCPIYSLPSPTGAPIGASSTIPPSAFYTRSIAGPCSITLNSLAVNGVVSSGSNGGSSGALVLNGSTSGSVTVLPQAAAGTPTVTFGTASGTPAVTASSPLSITTSTGNITCTACGLTSSTLAQFAATTSVQLAGVISDETGSGSLVFATSPTLVTPTLGAATATSINKVAITAPASSATLTVANGKTLTASNTLTFTGTDSSTVNFGAGGTISYTTGTVTSVTCNNGTTVITSTGTCASREVLTGARTYYVRTDGDNSTCNGMTDAAAASAPNCAFLTIAKATSTVAGLDISTNAVTVQVKSGTFNGNVPVNPPVGTGTYTIQGDAVTPSNVNLTVTSNSLFSVGNRATVTITGFKITTTTGGYCASITGGSTVTFGPMEFGACVSGHIYVAQSIASLASNYTISGAGTYHVLADPGSVVYMDSRTVSCGGGAYAFGSAFVSAISSTIVARAMTFSSCGSVTGQRYTLMGGTIITISGSATYFPGNVAGSTAYSGAGFYN